MNPFRPSLFPIYLFVPARQNALAYIPVRVHYSPYEGLVYVPLCLYIYCILPLRSPLKVPGSSTDMHREHNLLILFLACFSKYKMSSIYQKKGKIPCQELFIYKNVICQGVKHKKKLNI